MQVYHNLLQQGRYLCSVSTMHRLLRKQNLQGERRAQRAPQSNLTPRLLATAPNQVWTWDIAKLPTLHSAESTCLCTWLWTCSVAILSPGCCPARKIAPCHHS
jgi:transposase InsO family protein